jgi:hypothetical protein
LLRPKISQLRLAGTRQTPTPPQSITHPKLCTSAVCTMVPDGADCDSAGQRWPCQRGRASARRGRWTLIWSDAGKTECACRFGQLILEMPDLPAHGKA